MPVTIKHARIVVAFDLCSSSQIMEDLLLSDKFDRYEAFLTCVKRWLMNWTEQHAPPKGRFELYKVSLKFDNPEARRAHDFPVDAQQMEVKEELDYATGKSSAK